MMRRDEAGERMSSISSPHVTKGIAFFMQHIDHLSRRGFLRLAAGTSMAGAALGLLSACGSSAAPASVGAGSPASSLATAGSTKPAASGSLAASAAATSGGSAPAKPSAAAQAYPNYIPLANKPKADIASTGVQYIDGYINYPKTPQKSWTKAPPGLGSNVVSYTNAGAPLAPTPS